MYLSHKIVTLIYESGDKYVVSFEAPNTVKLFWEDENDFQCFVTFESTEEDSIDSIIEQSDSLVIAHGLELEDTLKRTIIKTNTFPP